MTSRLMGSLNCARLRKAVAEGISSCEGWSDGNLEQRTYRGTGSAVEAPQKTNVWASRFSVVTPESLASRRETQNTTTQEEKGTDNGSIASRASKLHREWRRAMRLDNFGL